MMQIMSLMFKVFRSCLHQGHDPDQACVREIPRSECHNHWLNKVVTLSQAQPAPHELCIPPAGA